MFLAVDQYWKGFPVNPGWEELWMKMMDKESRYILSLLSLLGSLSDNKTVTMEGIHSGYILESTWREEALIWMWMRYGSGYVLSLLSLLGSLSDNKTVTK